MNVMAYDVYETFAKPFSSLIKNNKNFNFMLYSLYAWTLPAIIVIISLIVQYSLPFDNPFNPAYGRTICGISHFTALVIFFFCPLSIISALNVTLFIITAHELKLAADETRFATKSKVKSQFVLNTKIILVLGLTWILGLLAMFIRIPIISYPSTILHGLQGVFIFVAFSAKKSVYLMILSRIRFLRGDHLIEQNERLRVRPDSRSDTLISLSDEKCQDRSSTV
jgi:hypothetical protein